MVYYLDYISVTKAKTYTKKIVLGGVQPRGAFSSLILLLTCLLLSLLLSSFVHNTHCVSDRVQ